EPAFPKTKSRKLSASEIPDERGSATSGPEPQADSANRQQPTAILFLSPDAGGYVATPSSGPFSDRFRVRAEALLGLARTAELDTPPPNLKFADECLVALFPFWRHIAETQLPANDAIVKELRLSIMRDKS